MQLKQYPKEVGVLHAGARLVKAIGFFPAQTSE
jgi:hypothetical protein